MSRGIFSIQHPPGLSAASVSLRKFFPAVSYTVHWRNAISQTLLSFSFMELRLNTRWINLYFRLSFDDASYQVTLGFFPYAPLHYVI